MRCGDYGSEHGTIMTTKVNERVVSKGSSATIQDWGRGVHATWMLSFRTGGGGPSHVDAIIQDWGRGVHATWMLSFRTGGGGGPSHVDAIIQDWGRGVQATWMLSFRTGGGGSTPRGCY